ncbi:diaminobutyrate acetyltransferase [Rhodococcus sp. TAF43]|uniref:diaminobutyrate acetyltransferase n=1 Tax=unclassified Rhodococcus (in: high G+C Gram-positive bacteria) TaxID=192944 RepID=UPI001583042E|nr:diaminobutyrate acetyltransferase [Rhodococcus sp. W8901]QKT12240.1 diaminobutyrate acetyltransferase [Rhodococcus sp. W8901]
MTPIQTRVTPTTVPDAVEFRKPQISDGVRLWEIAKDSQTLDVNSSYSYLLWCRDFQDTSIVSTVDGRVTGFVTGYIRPEAPNTLFVWQVAVDAAQRGRGLAGRMLNDLLDRVALQGVWNLETTISPDNVASIALFTSVAHRRGSTITDRKLFSPNDFPDAHAAENLYTISPQHAS